jgi:hypothetical protein
MAQKSNTRSKVIENYKNMLCYAEENLEQTDKIIKRHLEPPCTLSSVEQYEQIQMNNFEQVIIISNKLVGEIDVYTHLENLRKKYLRPELLKNLLIRTEANKKSSTYKLFSFLYKLLYFNSLKEEGINPNF